MADKRRKLAFSFADGRTVDVEKDKTHPAALQERVERGPESDVPFAWISFPRDAESFWRSTKDMHTSTRRALADGTFAYNLHSRTLAFDAETQTGYWLEFLMARETTFAPSKMPGVRPARGTVRALAAFPPRPTEGDEVTETAAIDLDPRYSTLLRLRRLPDDLERTTWTATRLQVTRVMVGRMWVERRIVVEMRDASKKREWMEFTV